MFLLKCLHKLLPRDATACLLQNWCRLKIWSENGKLPWAPVVGLLLISSTSQSLQWPGHGMDNFPGPVPRAGYLGEIPALSRYHGKHREAECRSVQIIGGASLWLPGYMWRCYNCCDNDLSSQLRISLVVSPACPSWRLGQEPRIFVFTSHSLLPEHCWLHRDHSHIFPTPRGCRGNSGSHVPPAPLFCCHLTVTWCQPRSCRAGDPSCGAAGRHIS